MLEFITVLKASTHFLVPVITAFVISVITVKFLENKED